MNLKKKKSLITASETKVWGCREVKYFRSGDISWKTSSSTHFCGRQKIAKDVKLILSILFITKFYSARVIR